MLTSDGLGHAQFLPLWRDAMFSAEPAERARLTLELGRAIVREERRTPTLLVAVVDGRDDPLVLMPLAEPPVRTQESLRDSVTTRLATLGASEVYVLLTVRGGGASGVQSALLACWGERIGGDEVCVMMPFRFGARGLEEAEVLLAPDAHATTFSQELFGLLGVRH
ncbi:MAG: hypothetical protein CVU56_23640 [Deltaproteobacteria bacterium HGW-Deltaproteobacteria-14]|jgi:hypothetical protein|nr:MAG: hypothetical protein CVU56_23640 [Deltaproteobacteria bacterium HGW-Deltaproteobacteria-14]